MEVGDVVEAVKVKVKEVFELGEDVPISAMELLYDGKPMMDPMSLKDYAIEAGATVTLEFKRK